eukprot:5667915-Pyramimonas_sp.AAC.1
MKNQLRASLLSLHKKSIRIGAGFSGCDMAWKAIQSVLDFWHGEFPHVPGATLAFTCEKDKDKYE